MKASVGEREIACLRTNKKREGTIRERETGTGTEGDKRGRVVEMHGWSWWVGVGRVARICLLASIRAVLLCLIAAK